MFSDFLNSIPMIILTLPAVLLSLSVHEAAHGYVAYKLGDPTARNLGRLTLNPLKHLNPIGFLSMLFFRVGWANPVPINTRYFKNPKRDMAISAAAGPVSNLCLGIIFTILLRTVLIPLQNIADGLYWVNNGRYYIDESLQSNTAFALLSVLAVMLYLGISLNFNLMFFNLIPLPPLDGSRIATMFLPSDLYFKIMRYERYIMIVFILLLASGTVSLPLSYLTGGLTDLLYKIMGMPDDLLTVVISDIINRLPTFSL